MRPALPFHHMAKKITPKPASDAPNDSSGGASTDAAARKPRATTPRKRAATSATPAAPAPAPTQEERAATFAVEAARTLADDKCDQIVVLDVRAKSPATDYIVIASGTSDRQMRSAIGDVVELGETLKYTAFRVSNDDRATWLLADFVNVVVHVFEPNTRAHYDLEMMWGDAPHVAWERPRPATKKKATTAKAEEP
jgi:ribosome-associated protein